MQANVTLTNSSEFYLNNEEVFLRDIPTSINVGNLSVDSLRLLVFYVAKAGPYKLAVESGFFTGTLEEWLTSLYGSGEGAGMPGPAGPSGADGKSTYDLFLETLDAEATIPSLEEWLQSLVGPKGDTGEEGAQGPAGSDGKNAYETYVEMYQVANRSQAEAAAEAAFPTYEDLILREGYENYTQEQYLDLKATTISTAGDVASQERPSEEQWFAAITGPKGDTGEQGPQGDVGPKGEDGVDGIDGVTQDATTITFTGLSLDDSAPVAETDTLLVVIGKLQAQITALEARLDAIAENPV